MVTKDDVAPEFAGLLDQPGGGEIDVIVLACTHFPLLTAELTAAAPRRLAFVDGGPGIARRVARLIGPVGGTTAPGRAVFTRQDLHVDALRPALAAHGLTEIDVV